VSDRRRTALSTLTRRPRVVAVQAPPDRTARSPAPADRPSRLVDNAVYATSG
jgi:magnesium transporter